MSVGEVKLLVLAKGVLESLDGNNHKVKESCRTDVGRNTNARCVMNSLCQILILKITATALIAKLVDGVSKVKLPAIGMREHLC